MPEWLARRDRDNGSWTVQSGQAVRGDAWTNATERVMRVPIGGDETNRVIRAHEMTHAKVSPLLANIGEAEEGLPSDVLRAAEEMRVNLITRTAGFDIDLLVDGSERQWGERLAGMGDYHGMATAIVAMAGTKASTAFLRGVRNVDPNMAKAIREVEKGALKFWKKPERRSGAKACAKTFGATTPVDYHDQQVPKGYVQFTLPVARFLQNAIDALTPPDDGDGNDDGLADDKAAERVRQASSKARGKFAPLVLDPNVLLDRVMTGRMGRKRIATNTGRNPRRINRMLTDPQRRVFDRTIRGKGGIVIIDQSGSMSLSTNEVEQMMEASPGCTIIGYSHRAGSVNRPNAWILARNGKRTSTIPSGNGGNGVDGPVVRYAASIAKKGEPIVWVCDGVVTDGANDACFDNLKDECARLVRRHGIHMVGTVEGGVNALQEVAAGKRLPVRYVGPIRSAAERLGIA